MGHLTLEVLCALRDLSQIDRCAREDVDVVANHFLYCLYFFVYVLSLRAPLPPMRNYALWPTAFIVCRSTVTSSIGIDLAGWGFQARGGTTNGPYLAGLILPFSCCTTRTIASAMGSIFSTKSSMLILPSTTIMACTSLSECRSSNGTSLVPSLSVTNINVV